MKKEFKNQLITALLSSPIVYIPHSHFAFVDEILHEIIHPLDGHRPILDIDDDSIMEFDMAQGIVGFGDKQPISDLEAYSKIDTFLTDVVNYDERFDKERIFIFKNFTYN